MNCKCNITVIIAFAYVIIYLVVRIYENPRFEYFEESANSAETLFHEPQIVNIDPRGNHIGVTFNRPQGATGLAKYMLFLKDENNNRILEKMIDFTESEILNEAFYSHLITPNNSFVLTIIAYNSENNAGRPTNTNIEVQEEVNENNRSLDIQLLSRISRDKERFLKQEREQTVQNRKIAELKRKIDDYRNDIVILKNNDRDDLKSVYQKLGYDDSVAEALMANGGDLNSALRTAKDGTSNGKNYNLNFNLEDE